MTTASALNGRWREHTSEKWNRQNEGKKSNFAAKMLNASVKSRMHSFHLFEIAVGAEGLCDRVYHMKLSFHFWPFFAADNRKCA